MLLIPKDIGPPATIVIIYRSPTFSSDLTTVTAVSLGVTRQNGTTATWETEIVSATEVELVVQYKFVGGEIDGTGPYRIASTLTVPDGTAVAQLISAFVGDFITPKLEDTAWLAATSYIPPGTGTGGGSTLSFAGVCTLEQFGAGTTSNYTLDRGAWLAALTALDAGTYATLLLGARTYLIGAGSDVATGILSNNDIAIRGWGKKSVLKTSGENQILLAHHTGGLGRLLISDLTLEGDWDGTTNPTKPNQTGIEIGYLGSDGAGDAVVSNVTFKNLQGRGCSIAYSVGALIGAIVYGCRFQNIGTVACYPGTQSAWVALSATGCRQVVHISAGNVGFYGIDFTQNVNVFFVEGGGNGAHGCIVGGRCNHNSGWFFQTDPANNGFSITGVHVYESGISITGTPGNRGVVRIDDSTLDLTATVIDGGTMLQSNCTYDSNYFTGLTILNNGQIEVRNPRALNGDLPDFIGDILEQDFTFPSNADQTASRQLSIARVIHIHTGALSTRHALSLTRGPALGESVIFSNETNLEVDCYWSSGAGIRLAAGETVEMGADGQDATCIRRSGNTFTVAPALGGGGDVIDPTASALTGFYRNFGGGTWPGTASAGTSGAKSLSAAAGGATVGAAVNGHTPAVFDGTGYLVDITDGMATYTGGGPYRVWFLVKATSLAAEAGLPYQNAGLVTDNGGEFGLVVFAGTAQAYHENSGYGLANATIAVGSWYLLDLRHDGTTGTLAVNGVDGTSFTKAPIASLGGLLFGTNFSHTVGFVGQILEAGFCDDALSTITQVDLKAYVEDYYNLELT